MSKEHADLMAQALEEMENQPPGDPTARKVVYQADVGRSTIYGGTSARVDGVTTSPKIAFHDVPYERIRNTHNNIESSDVEELLSYTYGKSVYEAASENFSSYDPSKLEEILSMSEEEIEDFLYGDEEEGEEEDE